MLDQYIEETRQLLDLPSAPVQLYSDATLTSFINRARKQVALDGECVRLYAPLATVALQQVYPFSAINISGDPSILAVCNVRMISRAQAPDSKKMINAWPWEYFNQYYVATSNPLVAAPTEWAQYGQGTKGSIFFYPVPDAILSLACDTVCLPISLVDDTTAEAIPYPWTECVCYFAAYLALLSAQTGQRSMDANLMFERYEEFKNRARRFATPSVLGAQYEQSGGKSVIPPVGGGAKPTQAG